MKRRDLLVGAPAAIGVTLVTRPARAAGAGTVKVGLIASLSGFAAAAGHEMVNGWNLYWNARNNMAGGSKIVTTVYDDSGNPAQGLNQARRAIEQDGAQMLIGPYLANVGY